MRKDRITTAALLLLLALIITSSVARLNSLGQQPTAGKPQLGTDHSLRKKLSAVKTKQELDALLDRLPAADYNAPESNDPEVQGKRRIKSSHYDKQGMVVKNYDASITFTEAVYEGKELWPLPVNQSDTIVVGKMRDSQSYLSNDKSGIYTEFTVNVSEVLKGDPAEINQGAMITASRVGGVVRYPGGHRRLYLVSGEGLPLEVGEYVFFLKEQGEDRNYTVLTIYRLEADVVTPIDEGVQFAPYEGQKRADFLKTIQDAISKSSQLPPEKE